MRHNKRVEFIKNQLLIWFLGSRWEFIFLWILDNIIKLSVKSCCATARNFVYFILISHIFTKYCQGFFYIYLEKCSKFILTLNFVHSHLKSQIFWNKVVSILNYNWVDVFMFIILNTQKKKYSINKLVPNYISSLAGSEFIKRKKFNLQKKTSLTYSSHLLK